MSIGNEAAQIPRWTVADRLRKALEHGGISAAEMAQYLEVHRNTVSNWIYGHAKPPASAVKLWAMRTGVSYRWLTYGDPLEELPRVDSIHQPDDSLDDLRVSWRETAKPGRHRGNRPTRAELLALRKALPLDPFDLHRSDYHPSPTRPVAL